MNNTLPECQYITLVKFLIFPGDSSFSLSGTMTLIKTAGPGAFISLRKGKVSVLFFFQVCGLEDKTFFFLTTKTMGPEEWLIHFWLKYMALIGTY